MNFTRNDPIRFLDNPHIMTPCLDARKYLNQINTLGLYWAAYKYPEKNSGKNNSGRNIGKTARAE